MLREISAGDEAVRDELFKVVYDELRAMAGRDWARASRPGRFEKIDKISPRMSAFSGGLRLEPMHTHPMATPASISHLSRCRTEAHQPLR
jgi:hypothetical protein